MILRKGSVLRVTAIVWKHPAPDLRARRQKADVSSARLLSMLLSDDSAPWASAEATNHPKDEALRPVTACFTGHRLIAPHALPSLARRLDAVLEAMWRQGYRRFISGAARGFDTLAAERVMLLRQRHPEVRLLLAIPCSDQSKPWNVADCRRYERMLYHADELRVLSPVYYVGCMQVRNRYMVDRSSMCLCFLEHAKGGTASTVAYAFKRDVALLNMAMADACAAFVRETASPPLSSSSEPPEACAPSDAPRS